MLRYTALVQSPPAGTEFQLLNLLKEVCGDAIVLSRFNSLFEMQVAKLMRSRGYITTSFNSLFEMQSHPLCDKWFSQYFVSILCLRCGGDRNCLPHMCGSCRFNSLFEMQEHGDSVKRVVDVKIKFQFSV